MWPAAPTPALPMEGASLNRLVVNQRQYVGGELGRRGPAPAVGSRSVDALGLRVDALHQSVDVAGVVNEVLQRGDHHRRGECGVGVGVKEMADVYGGVVECLRILLYCHV